MTFDAIKLFTILSVIFINNVSTTEGLLELGTAKQVIKFYTLQSNTNLTVNCKKQSDIYYNSVIRSVVTKEKWSLEMMDSSSKLQAGLYFGNLVELGAFDQCLGIDSGGESKIKGKYCLTRLKLPSPEKDFSKLQKTVNALLNQNVPEFAERGIPVISQRWAFCIPDACTAEDVQTHLNSYSLEVFKVKDRDCQTVESQPKLESHDWVVIGLLIGLVCIMTVSTIYDIYNHYSNKEAVNLLTIAFSCLTNLKKLTKISHNPEQLPCLNGIRVLSILWIIHGHEVSTISSSPIYNGKFMSDWIKQVSSLITLQSTVSVDSFFLLSGCLLMYGFLKAKSKKLPFNIPIFYFHRYLRLTPAYAAVVLLYATVFLNIGTGPNWESTNFYLQDLCRDYWWSSILYIQNYVNPGKICVGQSWYLSVDMQLYILSPLILIPIGKWPKIVPYFLGGLIILSTISPTVVAWHYEIPALVMKEPVPDWFKIYYAQLHTRAGPWIIGLALGYILYHTKHQKYRMNMILAVVLWLLTTVVMLYIIYGTYPGLQDDFEFSRLYNSLYVGLHRNLWSLGLCWIIFACIHGYGGAVNWILSLSMFQIFAKLSYSMYLTHAAIQNYDKGVIRVPILFTNFENLQSFFSTLCLTIIISIIWVLSFESPFAVIDNVITKSVMQFMRKDKSKQIT